MSNLPLMSESQLREAPFNQQDIPERDFNVTCSQSLSKTVKVYTDNYIPRKDGKELIIDTGSVNWADEYHNNDYYTPIQLITLYKETLKKQLESYEGFEDTMRGTIRRIEHLIEECENWTEDETEYIESL